MRKLVQKFIFVGFVYINILKCVTPHLHYSVQTKPICNLTLITEPINIPPHSDRLACTPSLVGVSRGLAYTATFINAKNLENIILKNTKRKKYIAQVHNS